ncbi:MAG: HPr(Ser) kinase/phosphatase, partial [Candidatus Heimdallarchaeota archaeon]|nr:HPr(Ser) kinase/phosphatase [Candidatus Heimdallarchaeota archaeon]
KPKKKAGNSKMFVQSKHTSFMTVRDFYAKLESRLKLKLLNAEVDLNRKIKSTDIHRPGLAFGGYYDYFACDSVQILGQTEVNYLHTLSKDKVKKNLKKFFTYNIPCLVISRNQKVPQTLLEKATEAGVPIFKSKFTTSLVGARITVFLEEEKVPEMTIHGTLVDVYGIGVLLLGESGAGKSECALELIERGHRLVADDIVEIKLKGGTILMGYSSDIIGHHMEIRGLGIINVVDIFGVGAIRNLKRISLVVTLENWNQKREYERLGLEEKTYRILDIELPHLIIPVRPGRSIPILLEVAALTQREKRMGINPAQEFNKRLIAVMNKKPQVEE